MSAHEPPGGQHDEQDLHVHRDDDGHGIDVLSVTGEMDLSTVPGLRAATEAVIADSGTVVLDLSGVSFMDSSGLALLLEIAGRVPSFGVLNPSRAVRRLIDMSGLQSVLKVTP